MIYSNEIELLLSEKLDGTDDETRSSNNSTNEEQSEIHNTPEYTPGCFEGPEKTMEVVFRPDMGAENGLRTLKREHLDLLCTKAKCTILTKIANQHMDAYVLSESSLFVYKHRYIMKTCGTTTLLRCLSTLLEFADELGMELTWVGYSRKNLLYPSAQLWPHSNFGDEIRYIDSHEKLQDRLKGSGYILGPITGDHWFVYVADHSNTSLIKSMKPRYIPPFPSQERTINMMMFDMDPEVAKIFFKTNTPSGKEMTARSGIFNLCPGAQIDETAFTPCGYSMNAILHDAYSTIHVTPEPECSYASFETNTCLNNYSPMVRNVLTIFRPKRFVLTMFGDQDAIDNIKCLPTDEKRIHLPAFGDYCRTSVSSTKVDMDLCCLMACYTIEPGTEALLRKPLSKCSSQSTIASKACGVNDLKKNRSDSDGTTVSTNEEENSLSLNNGSHSNHFNDLEVTYANIAKIRVKERGYSMF